jgi:hypothetical protein
MTNDEYLIDQILKKAKGKKDKFSVDDYRVHGSNKYIKITYSIENRVSNDVVVVKQHSGSSSDRYPTLIAIKGQKSIIDTRMPYNGPAEYKKIYDEYKK